jgi:TonB family protein
MNGAGHVLALWLVVPLAASAAAAPVQAPLDAATRALTAGYATSIVDKLCSVESLIAFDAARVRKERPDLGSDQLAEYRRHLEATAPELREACDKRVRDALEGEDGPLVHYGERLRTELSKSPAPREFEQLRAFLDSPAGRHAEAARRAVDAEAYLAFVQWGQRLARPLYDDLGMMLRADVGPLPPRADGAGPTSLPSGADGPGSPVEHARVRNGASLGSSCESFYPVTSRRLNEEGSVVLLVYVLATGRVGSVLVEHSSGFPALDVAAAGCIGAMAEFEPQKREGQPAASWQRMKWTWRLTE